MLLGGQVIYIGTSEFLTGVRPTVHYASIDECMRIRQKRLADFTLPLRKQI